MTSFPYFIKYCNLQFLVCTITSSYLSFNQTYYNMTQLHESSETFIIVVTLWIYHCPLWTYFDFIKCKLIPHNFIMIYKVKNHYRQSRKYHFNSKTTRITIREKKLSIVQTFRLSQSWFNTFFNFNVYYRDSKRYIQGIPIAICECVLV